MDMQRIVSLGAVVLAVVVAGTGPSVADGALAIGLPGDVARQGVSMGYSTNRDTMDEAKARAVAKCKEQGSTLSKSLCKVVGTFKLQCVALAIDPKAGTPGFGWAIAGTVEEAKAQALSNCRDTAGPSRRSACVVNDNFVCDRQTDK
jgi:Domain of unknown function (DUF4189)